MSGHNALAPLVTGSVHPMRFIIAALVLAATLTAGSSQACEAPDDEGLLYFSCAPEAKLLLLPEDAGAPDPATDALTVTGAYTATDRRDGGRPKPVGLMERGGEIVSREYVRFDGVLTISDGRPSLHYRRRVALGGRIWDLEQSGDRAGFLGVAAAMKAAVMQSHLLIIDGALDTAPIADAPVFRRRILFQMANGAVGVWDSGGSVLTLHEAASEVHQRFAPDMALNLDMGSYDFCQRGADLCGALTYAGTGKLSNMLRFR